MVLVCIACVMLVIRYAAAYYLKILINGLADVLKYFNPQAAPNTKAIPANPTLAGIKYF